MSRDRTQDQQSLLQYYSSETTAHATNLLALALVMLTAFQVLRDDAFRVLGHPLLLGLVFFVLGGVGAWMVGKMMYWAALANAVMYANPTNFTQMWSLHQEACRLVLEEGRSRFTRFSAHFRWLTWRDKHILGPWVSVCAGLCLAVASFVAL